MKKEAAVWFVMLVAAAQVQMLLATSPTVPAFLWSPHHYRRVEMNRAVNYQTISSKDLANSILSEGGWSYLLCSEKKSEQLLDVALVFVGRELFSSDISGSKDVDPMLIKFLKDSFTRSNFSMAFPYVATSDEETMENSLVSGFFDTCGQHFAMSNVVFSESCSVEDENFQKLADVHAFHDYLISKMEKGPSDKSDLVVFCQDSPSIKGNDQQQSESEVFSELIRSMDTSGAKYSTLYVSDPLRSIHYPSHRELERFLAESGAGNGSLSPATCDEVCQIKSSLLEGVLVGIVLLIILISGLCCMMGIDTPTRFETPQDS